MKEVKELEKSSSFSFINKSEEHPEGLLVAGTKKISQLDNLTNDILTGEAILPVVIADPLTPNRKAKVNQLFRGVAAGTKTAPGLAFDLDRDTGLYQTAYNELGLAFGTAGFYLTKISDTSNTVTNKIQALDDVASNVNILFQPKGAGTVGVQSGSTFRLQDTQFEIADDVSSAKRARFEVSNIGTGLRIFALPLVDVGNTTTLVGTDTSQTITNKTIRVTETNFSIIDGNKEAKFGIDWILTETGTKTYLLPDPGPGTIQSNIIDDVTAQNLSNKTLVQPSFAVSSTTSNKALFDASNLTASRTVTFPDLSITLVGTDSTQTLTAKTYALPVFSDITDPTKKVTFNLSNLLTQTNSAFTFPLSTLLNTTGTSVLVSELATQVLKNKSYNTPTFVDVVNSNRKIQFDLSNITSERTIQFPDGDATLLSTNNAGSLSNIDFGGQITAQSLGGRLRLQQYFIAGW